MGVTLNPPPTNTGMGIQTGNIWMNAAAGAASGVFDRLAQRIGVNYDQRKQYEQQKKLNDLQIMSESKLMDIQNQKQLEMWKATSYPAQVEQLRKAGLNPGLLYGQSGGGGTTTGAGMPSAGGGGAQSPNTHSGGMGIMNSAMLAGQMSLLDAQRRNIEADTANKEAATKEKLGDTPTTKATIDNIIANTENTKAKTTLTKIEQSLANFDLDNKTSTQIEYQEYLLATYRKATEELEILVTNNDMLSETKHNLVEQLELDVIGKRINNELQKQGIAKTQAEIYKMSKDIKIAQQQADAATKNADTNKQYQALQEKIHDLTDSWRVGIESGTRLVGDLISIITKRPTGSTTTREKYSDKDGYSHETITTNPNR